MGRGALLALSATVALPAMSSSMHNPFDLPRCDPRNAHLMRMLGTHRDKHTGQGFEKGVCVVLLVISSLVTSSAFLPLFRSASVVAPNHRRDQSKAGCQHALRA